MVRVQIFGLECCAASDAVVLRAELIYEGGAGSKCDDIVRDWKPNAKAAAAAKAAVGCSKTLKSAFKMFVHTSVAAEGGPGSPAAFLQRQEAALAVLEKHGLAGSLKNSWDSGERPDAWSGVKIQADPTGLALKQLLDELRGSCKKDVDMDDSAEEED